MMWQIYLLSISRILPSIPYVSTFPWSRFRGYRQKERSIVGTEFEAPESVGFIQCSIGSHVKIGSKSKINGCVIMDNVVIGEK